MGFLRAAPEQLAAALWPGREARLRWPDGQERGVRLCKDRGWMLRDG